ncbi:xanthine dehydrogenase family protein molybdopterin-binding subunit [Actinocrispum sp. NPDC049592]|uniref:xanthine dehydrogenase family protein molybdopterin-binding subunit n=1 Tax=Actinocrispum sp. NPDC049592 TaxID=3154835 RepID=UPI0034272D89
MKQIAGLPIDRIDGRAKVTGAAKYTADTDIPGVLHGVLVLSTIARGKITSIDTGRAKSAPGVVDVFTHLNTPRLTLLPFFPYTRGFIPMQDEIINHDGQPVAIVVAQTLEQAQYASTLVDVRYSQEVPKAVLGQVAGTEYVPDPALGEPNEFTRGDVTSAAADVKIDANYSSPTHHHNPIETSASLAVWQDGKLTAYETAQGIQFSRGVLAYSLGVQPTDVRVRTAYLGGGFGSKSVVLPHTLLTAAIARVLGQPLKVVLTRAAMYTSTGHRSEFRQRVALGATKDGKLTSLIQTTTQQASRTDEVTYNPTRSARMLYAVPNLQVRQQVAALDRPGAGFTRSPETAAHFGLETAMDELAYAVGVDPLELRLRNYAEVDPETRQPFTSRYLRDCYRMAANAFGWSRRSMKPGSTRDGQEFIGWGMATEAHSSLAFPSSALVQMNVDGTVLAQSSTQEIGTGTLTVMTQAVAEIMGTTVDAVTFQLGDSDLPAASWSAASATVKSVVAALDKAGKAVRDNVIKLAVADARSPLSGLAVDQVEAEHGHLFATGDRSRRDSYLDVMSRHGNVVATTAQTPSTPGYTTGAVFVEVRIDPRSGRVRVTRAVGAYDPGRVMNRKTARSQVIGGITWGIGFALMEQTVVDQRTARIVNPNLSGYLIPVNADVPDIQALFVDKPDPGSPALGARGFGEVPITGVPAAIGNAVFHATGRRIRDLPITQDKLL